MSGSDEARLITALKNGDAEAFMTLVETHQAALIRLANVIVHDERLAEEVVQETWIAVLKGIKTFEGRSSLKTWIYTILMNRAKTVARREGKYTPLGSDQSELEDEEPAVAPDRFNPSDSTYPRHWVTPPRSWDEFPEDYFLSSEVQDQIRMAINALPPQQREVITLRDINELSAEEACNILGISETNQRVLLHRARSRVRRTLEQYLGE